MNYIVLFYFKNIRNHLLIFCLNINLKLLLKTFSFLTKSYIYIYIYTNVNLYTISQQQFEDFVNINLTESNTLSSSNVKVIQTSEYTLYNNILDFPTKLPCFVKKKE